MKTYIYLLLLFAFSFTITSFKKQIFKRKFEYHYNAIFIKSNGDTLTNENIVLDPTGFCWLAQLSQTAYWVRYSSDTTNLIDFVNPINKEYKAHEDRRRLKEQNNEPFYGLWQYKDYSGAVENKEKVWMHPFRSNQYIYTEIAPFPEIDKNNLKIEGQWFSTLYIGTGYDNFEGVVRSNYTVKRKLAYSYKDINLNNCWEVYAVGKHSTLGENTNSFVFHPKVGFVEMNYTFFDGVKIQFSMTKIVNSKEK